MSYNRNKKLYTKHQMSTRVPSRVPITNRNILEISQFSFKADSIPKTSSLTRRKTLLLNYKARFSNIT